MSRTLVIGNKNYSSWSLRPWLAMRHAGLPFVERRIALSQPDSHANIARYSPSGRVPCLIDGTTTIWDSLAICETAAEQCAPGTLWPRAAEVRASARSATAEMHSGFAALRTHMPMDIRSRHFERGAEALRRDDVAADIDRIRTLWTRCLQASGGPFLFGEFSIADAFYAPVVTRFATYGVPLDRDLGAFSERILTHEAMREWVAAAVDEAETIAY